MITGIRRSGKSKLLDLMINHLLENNIAKEQIIKMNFESFEFNNFDYISFYDYVKNRSLPNKRMYLFFDELQKVDEWEKAINAFRVDIDCDIYITGSNAFLLSSEYSTYLSGRYIEIKLLPLSFKEFLVFHNFTIIEYNDAFGKIKKKVIDNNNITYELLEVFQMYLKLGGMPGLIDVGLNQEKANSLIESIYTTIFYKDIFQRDNIKGEKKITDINLLEKIARFLASNIGNTTSITSISNTLNTFKAIKNTKSKPSIHTVQDYIYALQQSYFFYKANRYDIKGKEYLKTLGKYYIIDPGLRNFLIGYDNDSGRILENIVYFELLKRDYKVYIGK